MLDRRLGVPVPLDEHALGLIAIEVEVVLERSGVLRPHDLHCLIGQAQVLLALALVKLESCDTKKLTHGAVLQDLPTKAGPNSSRRTRGTRPSPRPVLLRASRSRSHLR